jgi:hypothetical protein
MVLCGADICMLSFGGSACLPDVLPAGCRDIDDMLMKLPVRTHGDLQLHHELLCAKEAVLCMEDTKTVSALPVCFVIGDCNAGHGQYRSGAHRDAMDRSARVVCAGCPCDGRCYIPRDRGGESCGR